MTMEPITLETSTVAVEELEKGLRLLPGPWWKRIAHDLRIIHTRKAEFEAALTKAVKWDAVEGALKEWAANRMVARNSPWSLDAKDLEQQSAAALAADLARVEEKE
jgi:aryl-phospho-beta-D-glucosidase BglC (GH1 family)